MGILSSLEKSISRIAQENGLVSKNLGPVQPHWWGWEMVKMITEIRKDGKPILLVGAVAGWWSWCSPQGVILAGSQPNHPLLRGNLIVMWWNVYTINCMHIIFIKHGGFAGRMLWSFNFCSQSCTSSTGSASVASLLNRFVAKPFSQWEPPLTLTISQDQIPPCAHLMGKYEPTA